MTNQVWYGTLQPTAALLLYPRIFALLALSNSFQRAESATGIRATDEIKSICCVTVLCVVVIFVLVYCIRNEDACEDVFLWMSHIMGRNEGKGREKGRRETAVHRSEESDEDSSPENIGVDIGLSSSPKFPSVHPSMVSP